MEHIDISNQSLAAQEADIYRFVIRTTDLKDPVVRKRISGSGSGGGGRARFVFVLLPPLLKKYHSYRFHRHFQLSTQRFK